jgi:hypothetical protein
MGKPYPSTIKRRADLPETRGRKRSLDPLVFKTIGLTRAQWAWLDLWLPGHSATAQFRLLFIRCLQFWPGGPGRFR